MRRESTSILRHRFTKTCIGLCALALLGVASTSAFADPEDPAQLLRHRQRRGGVTAMPDRRAPALGLPSTAPQGGIIPITLPPSRGNKPPRIPVQYLATERVESSLNPIASLWEYLRGLRGETR